MKRNLNYKKVAAAYGATDPRINPWAVQDMAVANPEPLRQLMEEAYPHFHVSDYNKQLIKHIFANMLYDDCDEEIERAARRMNQNLTKGVPQGTANAWLSACARSR